MSRTPMYRKVIQLATLPQDSTPHAERPAAVYALCDDGTMWVIDEHSDSWSPLVNIPQVMAK